MSIAFYVGVAQNVLFNQDPTMGPNPYTEITIAQIMAYELTKKVCDLFFTLEWPLIRYQIEFAVILMSIVDLSLIKLSFLFFFARVFIYDKSNLRSIRNMSIFLMILLITIWGLGFSITYLAACQDNFALHWDAGDTTQCINTFWMLYALAISDTAMDCITIIIPIPLIWKLHLALDRKVGISIIFLLGSL
jgi:hypothetical protein